MECDWFFGTDSYFYFKLKIIRLSEINIIYAFNYCERALIDTTSMNDWRKKIIESNPSGLIYTVERIKVDFCLYIWIENVSSEHYRYRQSFNTCIKMILENIYRKSRKCAQNMIILAVIMHDFEMKMHVLINLLFSFIKKELCFRRNFNSMHMILNFKKIK